MGELLSFALLIALIYLAINQYKSSKSEYKSTFLATKTSGTVAAKKPKYLAALFLVTLIGVALVDHKDRDKEKPTTPPEKKVDPVKLTKWNWGIAGFGNVMMLSGKIENSADFPVKDIVVMCTLSAPSGTSLGSVNQTIYKTIASKKSLNLKSFNMGFIHSQSTGANCEVISYDKA